MHDPFLVRSLECLGDLTGNVQRLIEHERPERDALGQRLALDEFKNQIFRAFDPLQIVNRCDVGVVERGKRVRLALEAGQSFWVLCERVGAAL